jgi:hypothetical protein
MLKQNAIVQNITNIFQQKQFLCYHHKFPPFPHEQELSPFSFLKLMYIIFCFKNEYIILLILIKYKIFITLYDDMEIRIRLHLHYFDT